MSDKKTRLSRRTFLVTLGAGGAAAAAAAVATRPAPETVAKDGDKRSTQGYHVTEHVNNYYRSAKV
ncbi:MAG: twin-arginine translocation signal domain-containing protein [Betaproteobacteria bacterium]